MPVKFVKLPRIGAGDVWVNPFAVSEVIDNGNDREVVMRGGTVYVTYVSHDKLAAALSEGHPQTLEEEL